MSLRGELQKHFAEFFSSYKRGILGTTDKVGVCGSRLFEVVNLTF